MYKEMKEKTQTKVLNKRDKSSKRKAKEFWNILILFRKEKDKTKAKLTIIFK